MLIKEYKNKCATIYSCTFWPKDDIMLIKERQRAIRDYNIGMLTAERRGIEAGRKIGIEEGRVAGRAEGETLGVSRINQLILELSKHGRTEDIVKAAADEEYQKKLLEEFDL